MTSRLLPALALLVAVGLFFGYINPERTGPIATTRAQIESYESALAAADRFKEREGQLIVARANVPSDGLARLAAFLPDGVDNVQIILDLNTLAARSGVTLSDFDTAMPASETEMSGDLAWENGSVDSLDITLSATGTYAAFRNFLDGIESSLRLLDVVSVSVADSATGVYTYDMTIRLYWLR